MSESARLRRVDWLEAGLGALAEHGPAGVRIGSLCTAQGVTTGSFYHHFQSRADFLEALIDYWCESQVDAVIALVDGHAGSPLDRARRLEDFADELGIGPQDQEMRAWAKHDPRARAAVRKADRKIIGLLERLLDDLGVPAGEVGVLARVLFFTAIGSYSASHLLRPHRRRDISETVLALVTSRAQRQPGSSAPRGRASH